MTTFVRDAALQAVKREVSDTPTPNELGDDNDGGGGGGGAVGNCGEGDEDG